MSPLGMFSVYDYDFSGQHRRYTPQIISGTSNRFTSSNFRDEENRSTFNAPSVSPIGQDQLDAARNDHYNKSRSTANHQKRCREKKKNAISSIIDYLKGFKVAQDANFGNHGVADDLETVRNILEREFVDKMMAALLRYYAIRPCPSMVHVIGNEDPAVVSWYFWDLYAYLENQTFRQVLSQPLPQEITYANGAQFLHG